MSIIAQDIFDIAPELSSKPSNQVQAAINNSSIFINSKVWGAKAKTGQTYLAAFLLSFTGTGGKFGITMERTGDLQRSYGLLMNKNFLLQNTYGATFYMMMSTLVITPIVTGQADGKS